MHQQDKHCHLILLFPREGGHCKIQLRCNTSKAGGDTYEGLCRAGEAAGAEPALAAAEKLMGVEGRTDGLAPFCVDPGTGKVSGGVLTLGARADSYYEYMLKQWLIGGKQQDAFLRRALCQCKSDCQTEDHIELL